MNNKSARGRKPVVSDIFNTVDFPLCANVSPHGRVTAVSMMKDEGPFVLEWVAHHLALGFTDLLVFTNDCSDGTDDMLIRLEELGLTHHRRNVIAEGIRPQPSALKHAQMDPLVRASDWLMVFDADEFLCIRHGDGTIDGMISSAEEVGANGIVITWRIFGSGGVHDWSRAPVTEQYLYAAPPMWNKGWGVKTLFKFDPEYWKLGIHRPKIKNKHLETGFPDEVKWLNGSGHPMEDYFKFRGWRSIVRTVGYDWAQLNHYAVKSIDSYAIRKFRGNVNLKKDKYNSDYWALQDRNEIYDDAVLRHASRRKEIFDILLTDPVLSELHIAATERAESRLMEFKETPAYEDLVAGLKEASKVPISEVDAKPPKARDPAKIAALMSEVEKKANKSAKRERKDAPPPAWGTFGDLYEQGPIDLSGTTSVQLFENRGLKIPADPRIFTPIALQLVVDGKLERNASRRISRLVGPNACYLEIGAGVGFLAGVVAMEVPSATVVAHEEEPALVETAKKVLSSSGLLKSGRLKVLSQALFHSDEGAERAIGLNELFGEVPADVLVVNDRRVTADMIARALEQHSKKLPKTVVVGARAFCGEMREQEMTKRLQDLGYRLEVEAPLSTALLFHK